PEPVVCPDVPRVADARAADAPPLESGPGATSPVVPAWQERMAREPAVPNHPGMNPTADDPATAQFPSRRAGEPSEEAVMKTTPPQPAAPAEAVEEVHDTVPPAPAAEADAAAPTET